MATKLTPSDELDALCCRHVRLLKRLHKQLTAAAAKLDAAKLEKLSPGELAGTIRTVGYQLAVMAKITPRTIKPIDDEQPPAAKASPLAGLRILKTGTG